MPKLPPRRTEQRRNATRAPPTDFGELSRVVVIWQKAASKGRRLLFSTIHSQRKENCGLREVRNPSGCSLHREHGGKELRTSRSPQYSCRGGRSSVALEVKIRDPGILPQTPEFTAFRAA